MPSNTSDRSGFKMTRSVLKLKKRQESAERQNQARDKVLDDHWQQQPKNQPNPKYGSLTTFNAY